MVPVLSPNYLSSDIKYFPLGKFMYHKARITVHERDCVIFCYIYHFKGQK